MKNLALTFILLFTISSIYVKAQNKHNKSTKYPSYKGLIMAGYQGWFRAPGDGSDRGWGHYGRGSEFDFEHNTIDFWPDVSEYEKTYKTSFTYPDGTPAEVFSSVDKSTTDLHFKWMKEYGVDGVFMQRFFGVTRGNKNMDKPQDKILRNALEATKKNGRAIGVMYDLSGLKAEGEDCSSVIEDWKKLVDELKVTDQGDDQTYIFHNGKPLVTIWGVGFPDRSCDIRKIGVNRLIDFLKNDPVYGGCSVMLGVPTYFRDLDKDCVHDPYLHEIIESVDIVLPRMVQRFTPYLQKPIDHQRDHIIADIKWCKERDLDYAPIAYPGFSWRNFISNNLFLSEAEWTINAEYQPQGLPPVNYSSLEDFREVYGNYEEGNVQLDITADDLFRDLSRGDFSLNDLPGIPPGTELPESITKLLGGTQGKNGPGAFAFKGN